MSNQIVYVPDGTLSFSTPLFNARGEFVKWDHVKLHPLGHGTPWAGKSSNTGVVYMHEPPTPPEPGGAKNLFGALVDMVAARFLGAS